MMKELREPRVPPLRHPRRDIRSGALLRVEVNVEVLGAEHLEVEISILDFVLSEVLGRAVLRGHRESADRETAHDDGMEAVQDFHAYRPCKAVTFRTCLIAGQFACCAGTNARAHRTRARTRESGSARRP